MEYYEYYSILPSCYTEYKMYIYIYYTYIIVVFTWRYLIITKRSLNIITK